MRAFVCLTLLTFLLACSGEPDVQDDASATAQAGVRMPESGADNNAAAQAATQTDSFADAASTMLAATDDGHFRVVLKSAEQPVPMRRIHSWWLEVQHADGRPVSGATIRFDGGMPDHDHGFPTVPRVSADIEPGLYRIDGIKFSMSGHWRMQLAIAAGDNIDAVTFDMQLAP